MEQTASTFQSLSPCSIFSGLSDKYGFNGS
jgi:hypothetical protein